MRKSIVLLALPLLAACGSGSDSVKDTGGGGGGATSPLAPPTIGMQLKSAAYTLDPGAEHYACWSFQVPADASLQITGLENQIPKVGVHHYAVFTNSAPMKEAGPYDCETMGITWGLVSGGGVGTPGVEFPKGAAMTLPAGQHVILQLHLLNASTEKLEVEPAYVNLVGTKDTNVQQVGLLIAGTLDISIPAHSTDVTASGGCAAPEAMDHIFSVFPHMHQLGRRITAQIQPTPGGDPLVVADQTWDFSDQGLYPVEGSAKAGDQVQVTCHWDNPGDKDVGFGLGTHDEMCVNVLYYYPATKRSAYCGIQ